MNHEINLTGYTASCNAADNMLCLGTAGSYGLEKLHVTADAAWDGLTITATFTNSGSTTVAVTGGAVDVPPEATRMPTRDRVRYGQIAFKGADADGSIRLISTPIYYKVQASSATDGENTIAPTPDQYAQFVAEVTAEADRAEAAAKRAENSSGSGGGSGSSGIAIEDDGDGNVVITTADNLSWPTVSVKDTVDGANITFTDAKGEDTSVDIYDGEDGTAGADGYTPVKGTDYWTEADKAEIVNEVLSSLTAAEEVSS